MDVKLVAVLLGEILWGLFYAWLLDRPGWRQLDQRITFVSVVIGVAGTAIVAWPVIGTDVVLILAGAFVCSSVGVVVRGVRHLAASDIFADIHTDD